MPAFAGMPPHHQEYMCVSDACIHGFTRGHALVEPRLTWSECVRVRVRVACCGCVLRVRVHNPRPRTCKNNMRALEALLAGFPSSSPLAAAELPRVGCWCFVPKSLPQSSFAICACLKNISLSLPKLPNELPTSNRSFIPSRHCQPDPVPSLNAGAGAAGSKGGMFSGPVDSSYCTLKASLIRKAADEG